MSEWLKLMLEEIARREREADEASAERERRERDSAEPTPEPPAGRDRRPPHGGT